MQIEERKHNELHSVRDDVWSDGYVMVCQSNGYTMNSPCKWRHDYAGVQVCPETVIAHYQYFRLLLHYVWISGASQDNHMHTRTHIQQLH